jgi:hypothetical protein
MKLAVFLFQMLDPDLNRKTPEPLGGGVKEFQGFDETTIAGQEAPNLFFFEPNEKFALLLAPFVQGIGVNSLYRLPAKPEPVGERESCPFGQEPPAAFRTKLEAPALGREATLGCREEDIPLHLLPFAQGYSDVRRDRGG